MPGAGKRAVNVWRVFGRRHNALIVCPTFSAAEFPGEENYNLGGLRHHESAWTLHVIEAIFARLGAAGVARPGYLLYGHSAGAQFVHRFVVFMGAACHLLRAVAANAGWLVWLLGEFECFPICPECKVCHGRAPQTFNCLTNQTYMGTTTRYTLPVRDAGSSRFPYSLRRAPTKADVGLAFARRLTVLLGQDDTDTRELRMTRPLASFRAVTRCNNQQDLVSNGAFLGWVWACS